MFSYIFYFLFFIFYFLFFIFYIFYFIFYLYIFYFLFYFIFFLYIFYFILIFYNILFHILHRFCHAFFKSVLHRFCHAFFKSGFLPRFFQKRDLEIIRDRMILIACTTHAFSPQKRKLFFSRSCQMKSTPVLPVVNLK